MSELNLRTPFKYTYIQRRTNSIDILNTFNYSDTNINQIPEWFNILLLKRGIPLEIISIIWNITLILEDLDLSNYLKKIYCCNTSKKAYKGITLRSKRNLKLNINQIGIMCNFMSSNYHYNGTSKDSKHSINFIVNFIIVWYEFIKENKYFYELQVGIIDKVNEFYNKLMEKYDEKRNCIWYNTKEKENFLTKLLLCKYYIKNYYCIVNQYCAEEEEYCYNCYYIDQVINEKKIRDTFYKKSYTEKCEILDNGNCMNPNCWFHIHKKVWEI